MKCHPSLLKFGGVCVTRQKDRREDGSFMRCRLSPVGYSLVKGGQEERGQTELHLSVESELSTLQGTC